MRTGVSVTVSPADRHRLTALIKDRNTPQKHVWRAEIILLSAEGAGTMEIMRRTGKSKTCVWRWQERFAQERVDGLTRDKTRPSRIPPLGAAVAERVVALTLEDPPGETTNWTAAAMAQAAGISASAVRRIWKAHGLQPHRWRRFKLSRDPDFVAKLRDVVGLYLDPPAHAVVLSVDEKSQIQVLDRTQPGLPMKKGRLGTMTHEYKRHGTTPLFAALNALDGTVVGRNMARHRHQEFIRFLNAINAEVPADRAVHVILDNYAAHKHPKVRAWLDRHPRFAFHFTPTSASWLNAVEGFFAKLFKRRLQRGVFCSLVELQAAINRFLAEHNTHPKPFVWTADPDRIVAAVKRGHQVLDSILLDQDSVLMPGLVDSHVHICEPGNTEWEGFLTATRAAAAGGITTLVDMPLDSVPTTVTLDALEAKRTAANGRCHVDVGFWGGAIPSNLAHLPALHEAGVLGFKSFLCDTGTYDFPGISPEEMSAVMRVVAELDSLFIVHAESAAAMANIPEVHTRHYADYLASRPRGIENLAIAEVIEAARSTGARAHILHLSSADALPMIASAIEDGARLSVETCPHYLTLSAEGIAEGATAAKVGPPVREERNREALWAGIADRMLDMIVSDHSPCTPAMKEPETGDFGAAWGGIPSLQLGLPVVWTEACRRGYGLTDVARWMAEQPARLAGLHQKGRIAVGCDADFAVLDPDSSFVVDPARLHHRHPITPYAGLKLNGVVRETYLRGKPIDVFGRPAGQLIARQSTATKPTLELKRSA